MISTGSGVYNAPRARCLRIQSNMNESDYVIVGGGTAGCVVAARLAGARLLRDPCWRRADPTRASWIFLSLGCGPGCEGRRGTVGTIERRRKSSLGGRSVWYPAGRIVGGSSAINAMIYCRGHRSSYDRWGVAGWSYADLLPYFRRAEDHENGASEYHGTGGPIGVAPGRFPSSFRTRISGRLRLAGNSTELRTSAGNRGEGAGFYHLTQRDGRRSSTANSYMTEARSEFAPGRRRACLADSYRTGACGGNRVPGAGDAVHGPRRARSDSLRGNRRSPRRSSNSRASVRHRSCEVGNLGPRRFAWRRRQPSGPRACSDRFSGRAPPLLLVDRLVAAISRVCPSTPRLAGVERSGRGRDRAHHAERGGPGHSSRVPLARDAGTAGHARGVRDWLDRSAQPRPRPARFSGP